MATSQTYDRMNYDLEDWLQRYPSLREYGGYYKDSGPLRFDDGPYTSYVQYKFDFDLLKETSYGWGVTSLTSGFSSQLNGSQQQLTVLGGGIGLQGSYDWESGNWSLLYGFGAFFDTPKNAQVKAGAQVFLGGGFSNEGLVDSFNSSQGIQFSFNKGSNSALQGDQFSQELKVVTTWHDLSEMNLMAAVAVSHLFIDPTDPDYFSFAQAFQNHEDAWKGKSNLPPTVGLPSNRSAKVDFGMSVSGDGKGNFNPQYVNRDGKGDFGAIYDLGLRTGTVGTKALSTFDPNSIPRGYDLSNVAYTPSNTNYRLTTPWDLSDSRYLGSVINSVVANSMQFDTWNYQQPTQYAIDWQTPGFLDGMGVTLGRDGSVGSNLSNWDEVKDFLKGVGSLLGNVGFSFSFPIILDLDGTGVEITELRHSTTFMDSGGDGLQHRTAWAAAGNGVLFFDPDGRNAITEDRQYIFTKWDPTAADDMAALRGAFDTNGDGKLTNIDTDFAKFKVLVTNADGSTTVQTLGQLNITEINLLADATNIVLPDGSMITGQTTFTKVVGNVTTTGTVANTTLAAEGQGYKLDQTVTTDVNGNRVVDIKAYAAGGDIAFASKTVTSPTGALTTISYDDNGDGVWDRIQSISKVTNGNLSKTTTVTTKSGGVDAAAVTVNVEQTTVSADNKIITINRDSMGGGWFDQSEVRTTNANGSVTDDRTHVAANDNVWKVSIAA
jgi:hypothetical protein